MTPLLSSTTQSNPMITTAFANMLDVTNSQERKRLLALFEERGWKQKEVAIDLGYADHSLVSKYLRGAQRISENFLNRLSTHNKYRVSIQYIKHGIGPKILLNGNGNAIAKQVGDTEYISLPYLPVPARASFVEMIASEGEYGYPEKYTIVKDPTQNYTDNVIIEVDGDSMEPYYPSGTKVRCVEVDKSNWQYINSGVFAVSYASSFVIKRVKNNDFSKGYLVLHSDNTDTGGMVEVPVNQLRCVLKVLRIVDAPAR